MNDLQININPAQIKSIPYMECSACKGTDFLPLVQLKKVPAIVTATSRPVLIEFKVYKCIDCELIYTPHD